MRKVGKGAEPPELLAYRKSEDTNRSYANFPGKAAVRTSLLRDQKHLCCYCMRRISDVEMKIEHFRSQRHHEHLELEWKNMLGTCRGGEGQPARRQTCDTRKGDQDITIDPLGDVERVIRYTTDGRVESDDPQMQQDIEERLNLNDEVLQQNRRDVLDGAKAAYEHKLGKAKTWTKRKLEDELRRFSAQSELPAMAGVVEDWLRRLIRRRR